MFNAYQLRGIAEDIEYFRDQWQDGTTNPELRRDTTILRRLMIDGGNGTLLPVWRALGFEGQPTIPAYPLRGRRPAANLPVVGWHPWEEHCRSCHVWT